ncbi:hypothetical protein U27_05314 [Candidatus Vecturithrix granuli]|uniref:Uncharacterized protein n=1 Tax=Vecturithrix granuli TaxID=1499967 RepID=A0A081C185_VECG1|nr:hypothetical protein U27_05314 [Candidatus Vecturithrix granuli]
MSITVFYHRICQWSVIGVLLLIMVSVLVPVVTRAQQTTPASEGVIVNKIEDLVGIWESQHGDSGAKAYRQYEANGTIREAYSLDNLQTSPLHIGHVWFENNVYCQKNDHPLAPDSPGKYEVRIHKAKGMPDRLSFRVIDDADKFRVKDFTAGMTRVEPALQTTGEIVTRIEVLVGLWKTHFRGIEAYMQYAPDGTYWLAYNRENLQSFPLVAGRVWFEGSVYYQQDQGGGYPSPYTGKYEVLIQKEGDVPVHLVFRVIDDPEKTRVKDLTAGMTRVEP